MAKVFTHAGGVVGVRASAAEEARAPLPADAANVVAFDEDTNAALLADLAKTTTPYTIAAGVLKKNGNPVTPAADGDRKALVDAATAAVAANQQDATDNATYLAIASPSNAQVAAQVRALTQHDTRRAQQVNQLIRRLLQLSQ